MYAQGQLKNIPFSDILNINLHQWKETGKTYLLPFNLSDGEDQNRMFHQF